MSNIQVLVSVADAKEEHGALGRDGDLVRLERNALCCLSGRCGVLLRRWEKGTLVVAVVQLLALVHGVSTLAIISSRRFMDSAAAMVFITHFRRCCDLTAIVWKTELCAMELWWTQRHRRKLIGGSVDDSQCELKPMSFAGTPVKF